MAREPEFSAAELAAAERFGAKVRALARAAEEGRLAEMSQPEVDQLMARAVTDMTAPPSVSPAAT